MVYMCYNKDTNIWHILFLIWLMSTPFVDESSSMIAITFTGEHHEKTGCFDWIYPWLDHSFHGIEKLDTKFRANYSRSFRLSQKASY